MNKMQTKHRAVDDNSSVHSFFPIFMSSFDWLVDWYTIILLIIAYSITCIIHDLILL